MLPLTRGPRLEPHPHQRIEINEKIPQVKRAVRSRKNCWGSARLVGEQAELTN